MPANLTLKKVISMPNFDYYKENSFKNKRRSKKKNFDENFYYFLESFLDQLIEYKKRDIKKRNRIKSYK